MTAAAAASAARLLLSLRVPVLPDGLAIWQMPMAG